MNRRTADVRSVGYSELFSLSRDDVLAATTDYPEAREILQALGRKRLMEVRSINKKHAKHVSDRESIASKFSIFMNSPMYNNHDSFFNIFFFFLFQINCEVM